MIRFILEVLTPVAIGTVVGYVICALMTMSSHGAQEEEIDHWRNEAVKWEGAYTLKAEELHAAKGRK